MTITTALALIVVLGEWTGLARSIVGAPAYAAVLDIALAALAMCVLVRVIRTRSLRLDLLSVLIGAYIVLSLVEIANPNVPSLAAGVDGFRKTALMMVGFFIVRYAGESDPRRFLKIVVIGSIPAFAWAIGQVIWPLPIDLNIITTSGVATYSFHSSGVLRAFAPTAGPFHLGLLAACVLVVAFVLARSDRRSWSWLALACLAAWVLGLTLTRANVIAGICALGVLVIGARSLRERLRSGVPAAALVGVMLFAGVSAVAASTLNLSGSAPAGASSGDLVSGLAGQVSDKNLELRFGYWADFVKAVEARPLIGYGTSSAADGFNHYYSGTGSVHFDPHSLYFKPALELGLGGLVIFLAILAQGLVTGLRVLRIDRPLGLVWLAVLAAVAVSGVTGPMLDAYPVNLFFWATFGWAALVAARGPTSNPAPSTHPSSPA